MSNFSIVSRIALAPTLLAGCASMAPATNGDGLQVIPISITLASRTDGIDEIVGNFEIANRSDRPICVSEDILINKLSPFVHIKERGMRQTGDGIPNPPLTANIVEIAPQQQRSFQSVIDYRKSQFRGKKRYTVSLTLRECETETYFRREAVLEG